MRPLLATLAAASLSCITGTSLAEALSLPAPAKLLVRVSEDATPARVDLSETFDCANTRQVGVVEPPAAGERASELVVAIEKDVETLVTVRSRSCAMTLGFKPESGMSYELVFGNEDRGCRANFVQSSPSDGSVRGVPSAYKRSSTCKR